MPYVRLVADVRLEVSSIEEARKLVVEYLNSFIPPEQMSGTMSLHLSNLSGVSLSPGTIKAQIFTDGTEITVFEPPV